MSKKWLIESFLLLIVAMTLRAIVQGILRSKFGIYSSSPFWSVMSYSFLINFIFESIAALTYFLLFILIKRLFLQTKPKFWAYLSASIIATIPIAVFWNLIDFKYLLKPGNFPIESIWNVQKDTGFQYVSFLLFSIGFYFSDYFIQKK